jgi:hypothetical protein
MRTFRVGARPDWRIIFGGILGLSAVAAALWYANRAMRRMRLFDAIRRHDEGPRPYAQPDFEYLNISARPGVEAIRATLEHWFSRYPKAGRAELSSRFRSDNLHHRSAFFELFLHELLLRFGCKIGLHPELPGTTRRPDFVVTSQNGERFYLEAVLATDQSKEEMAAEARKNQVYDSINKLNSPDFYVGMDVRGEPATPPSGKTIRTFLAKRLGQLNRDEVGKLFEEGGFPALPQWRYEHNGWTIDFFPFPKSGDTFGKMGVRPIGIQFEGFKWIETKVAIRNAILEKAGRYGKLLQPYVIALNVFSDHLDDADVIEALFGDERLIYSTGTPQPQAPRLGRSANGVWDSPSGPKNTRVSGVLIFDHLSQSNIPWVTPCLYHNPWAAIPYRGPLNQLRRGVVANNKMEYSDGQVLSALFGLPNDWPGK